jgi:DNA modification methylase
MEILETIKKFTEFGTDTLLEQQEQVDYYINEFWTAKQRQASRLHEISYRACFKPQLPEFFIDNLTKAGDTVYDPFMGRGTTPLQAAIMGRKPIGNDINPLCEYLIKPRMNTPTLAEIQKRLEEIPLLKNIKMEDDFLVFFHPETLKRIMSLRKWFLDKKLDYIDEWIRMIALNRLTGHSAGFFSVYTMPPNQAVSADSQRKINEKRKQTPQPRNVDELIIKKSKTLLSGGVMKIDNFRFGSSPVNETKFIDDGEVDLIVTSPPFLDVVDYKTDNWMRCWFAGIDADKIKISEHRSITDWQNFIHDAFVEFERIVKEGGHVAFEVGEVRNGKVKLEKLVTESIKGLSFDLLGVVINTQDFTKTSNCWGIINNSKGTNTNRIVLCKKI